MCLLVDSASTARSRVVAVVTFGVGEEDREGEREGGEEEGKSRGQARRRTALAGTSLSPSTELARSIPAPGTDRSDGEGAPTGLV
jgi:hypothetical protein